MAKKKKDLASVFEQHSIVAQDEEVEQKEETQAPEAVSSATEEKVEKKAEEPPAAAEEKAEEKVGSASPPSPPPANWESEENPYRKRYYDTARWATTVNQLNAELRRQLEIINKKLDGTYDPEKDAPPAPSPEVLRASAEQAGRARASLQAAYQTYGKEKVDAWLTKFHEVFGEDPFVQARILASDMPVFEAINAVKGYEFFARYGSDPDAIAQKIRAEVEQELAARQQQEQAKKLAERASLAEKQPKTLAKVKGSSVPAEAPATERKSLGEIFQK